MVQQFFLTALNAILGSHPCRVVSVSDEQMLGCHGEGRWFEPFRKFPRLNQSSQRSRRPARHPSSLCWKSARGPCCYKGSLSSFQIACVRTVSEPLRLGPLEICFERRADSPSCCFFEKAVRKRRAFRPGFRAPKAGALPGCATPRLSLHRRF